MDKIDIRDMILRTLKENKIEVDNFNDAVFEDDFLKVAETIVKNLPIYVVMQQRELLIAFAKYMEEDKMYARHDEANADDFLENYSN
jgi:hypothetical protein